MPPYTAITMISCTIRRQSSWILCPLAVLILATTVAAQPFDAPEPFPAAPPVEVPTEEEDRQPNGRRPANSSPPAGEAATDKPLPADFIKLYLMDGSVIAGRLSMKEIGVETEFGNLSVPVESIKSLTPGLQSHPALAKQVSGLIADLGSGNYNDREKAQQALIKMGPSVRSELERYQSDNDVERRNRVKAILTEFDQLADDFDAVDETDAAPSMRQGDTIVTTAFTIVGKIVPQSFAIKSPYGELNVKLADIRKGERASDEEEDIRKSFTVDGSHLATRGALNTGIRIQRGDTVTVSADGTITMTPWGNNAITTPDGAQNYGWFIPGQIPSGALVGKIGNDSFTKFGSKTTFTAARSGVLQLAIGMQASHAQNQFPGKYNVKVRVQRKQQN